MIKNQNKELDQSQTKKDKSKVFEFFNSPIPIIITLAVFIVVLLFYINFISKSITLYNFNAVSDEFTFHNGTIYIGRNINYFGDSKVNYSGKDIVIHDFEVGYYIKKDDLFSPIAVVNEIEDMENGASLKKIIESTNFSFVEQHARDAKYLSEKNITNIYSLIFRISGKNAKDEEINIEIPLEVNKLSK